MAGGAGTRLDAPVEKPLFEVGDIPMIDRVLGALEASQVDEIVVAVSPQTPETGAHIRRRDGVTVVETPGDGYVADLDEALSVVDQPTLTVAADLPLLAAEPIDRVLAATNDTGDSVTVCVPEALKEQLGVSVDTATDGLAPTGLNVVADSQTSTMHVRYDARLAVNVNRQSDAAIAEALLWE